MDEIMCSDCGGPAIPESPCYVCIARYVQDEADDKADRLAK